MLNGMKRRNKPLGPGAGEDGELRLPASAAAATEVSGNDGPGRVGLPMRHQDEKRAGGWLKKLTASGLPNDGTPGGVGVRSGRG